METLLRLLLVYFAAGAPSVTLKWDLNILNPDPPVIHTRVYRALSPCTKFGVIAEGLNGLSWTDTSVQAGKTYCYYLTERNPRTGLESGKSNEIKVTVP